MVLNEKKYPLTYKEYEQKVVELFLENYSDEDLEIMVGKLDTVLSESPNILEQEYGYACFDYDHPEIYGENCKKTFDDYHLRQTPVAHLRKML